MSFPLAPLLRAATALCAAAAVVLSAGGPASAVAPRTDDGYRTPPRPQTLSEGLWWFDAMKLAEAHREVRGEGATVAVIDDQLDTSVPELRGQDVHLRTTCRGTPLESRSLSYADHGTSMATLIAGSGRGTGPGGAGIKGVAPEARVLFYSADLLPKVRGIDCNQAEVADLFDTAVRDGVDIIMIAISMEPGPELERAVRDALAAGVVVVAAAGSRADATALDYPATYPGVVSVGAVDQYAQLWSHTPRNQNLVVAAPGVWVGSGRITRSGWTSEYVSNGTSPATAITAGALALLRSEYPDATGSQLVQHLIHTPGGDGYDWHPGYGFGIVNVANMLASDPAQWPDENPLMSRPEATLRDYPLWVSTRVPDPPGRGDDRTGPAHTDESPAHDHGGSDEEEAAATGGDAGDGGPPAWAWAAGAAGLAVAVMAGVAATRSRASRRIERTSTQGV